MPHTPTNKRDPKRHPLGNLDLTTLGKVSRRSTLLFFVPVLCERLQPSSNNRSSFHCYPLLLQLLTIEKLLDCHLHLGNQPSHIHQPKKITILQQHGRKIKETPNHMVEDQCWPSLKMPQIESSTLRFGGTGAQIEKTIQPHWSTTSKGT